ncbi:Retrovirus-related Pol poly from transposon, partial [Paramuricea clavata]
KSGALRICIDPKPLNEALKRERYQIPVIDDLLPNLSEARVFFKVDLASAFWHLELDEESSKLTTFSTPYGRFRWLRLPFGLNVSSEIFQERLNQELLGLEGVRCIADDILVYGTNEKDDQNFERLLERCKEKSIKLN